MAHRFNLAEKKERSARLFRFKKYTLQLLALEEDVYEGEKGTNMYWFDSCCCGKVVIYPKGDKIHLPLAGKWIDGVEEWLKLMNFIKD